MDMGAETCIFQIGVFKSCARARDGEFRMPAFKASAPYAAGRCDACCGGFVAGPVWGVDLESACRRGSTVSASMATGAGSDAGVRHREQVKAFMATAVTIR
jgi:sugar/nucleoside kinase (ribokinase family)